MFGDQNPRFFHDILLIRPAETRGTERERELRRRRGLDMAVVVCKTPEDEDDVLEVPSVCALFFVVMCWWCAGDVGVSENRLNP